MQLGVSHRREKRDTATILSSLPKSGCAGALKASNILINKFVLLVIIKQSELFEYLGNQRCTCPVSLVLIPLLLTRPTLLCPPHGVAPCLRLDALLGAATAGADGDAPIAFSFSHSASLRDFSLLSHPSTTGRPPAPETRLLFLTHRDSNGRYL